MLRAFAARFAKRKYVWNKELEAGMHEWSARVAEQNAKASRDLIVKLKNEADAYEVRINNVAEMGEKGFWQCEDGHERPNECACALPGDKAIVHSARCPLAPVNGEVRCPHATVEAGLLSSAMPCGKPMKLIKRDLMTAQEKYESDKDRTRPPNISEPKPSPAGGWRIACGSYTVSGQRDRNGDSEAARPANDTGYQGRRETTRRTT
jgi:hypothetical protein